MDDRVEIKPYGHVVYKTNDAAATIAGVLQGDSKHMRRRYD